MTSPNTLISRKKEGYLVEMDNDRLAVSFGGRRKFFTIEQVDRLYKSVKPELRLKIGELAHILGVQPLDDIYGRRVEEKTKEEKQAMEDFIKVKIASMRMWKCIVWGDCPMRSTIGTVR